MWLVFVPEYTVNVSPNAISQMITVTVMQGILLAVGTNI
jgi:hypothetical protein